MFGCRKWMVGWKSLSGVAVVAVVAVAVAGFWAAYRGNAQIALGRAVYAEYCATCHGAELQGQPNWQEPLPNGRLPAPPHDATGHTWHHSDHELFTITKKGLAAVVPGYESDMPAFGTTLSDDQITAVLAYIKSTWPEREREYQRARTSNAR